MNDKMMKVKYLAFTALIMTVLVTNCTNKTMDTNIASKSMNADFRKKAPEAGPAPRIQMGEYQLYKMENGLTVIVVENHKLPRVSFSLVIDNDPILEGDKAGLSEITGSLLSRGTMKRSKSQIDEAIDYIGGRFNTGSTGIFGSCLTKHKDVLLNIVSDVLIYPAFPPKELEKIKYQMNSELQAAKNDPNQISATASQAINFGSSHPYGDVVTEETLENINIDDCKAHYESYWSPVNAYLAIVGDVTFEEAKAVADEHFSQWNMSPVMEHDYDYPAETDARVCFIDKPGAVQSVIRVTYPLEFKPNDPDRVPASVMNSILGGGVFSGYLMQNLREDKAYTYGARSSLSNNPVMGQFMASASVRNEVTDSAVTEFLREMNRIRDEQVDPDHLQLVKNSLSGSFARSLEKPQNLASRVINIVRYNLPEDYYETFLEKVNAVSIEDVQRVARRFIRPENANIVIVGNKEEVADKLYAFAASGSVEYFDEYGKLKRKSRADLSSGIDANEIVNRFIEALGGKEKLLAIENLVMETETSVQDQVMKSVKYMTNRGDFRSEASVSGMPVHMMIVNEDDVYMEQMGSAVDLSPEDKLEMRNDVQLFKELQYLKEDWTLELDGSDVINDRDVYILKITSPNGEKVTEYYDSETGLKVRQMVVKEMGEEQTTILTDLSDYNDVEGINFPHTITRQGVAPFELVEQLTSLKFNEILDENLFVKEQ
jgi:predicted Zn-dependent peptidase